MRAWDGVKLAVTVIAAGVLVTLDVQGIPLSASAAGLLGGIAVRIFPTLWGEK